MVGENLSGADPTTRIRTVIAVMPVPSFPCNKKGKKVGGIVPWVEKFL